MKQPTLIKSIVHPTMILHLGSNTLVRLLLWWPVVSCLVLLSLALPQVSAASVASKATASATLKPFAWEQRILLLFSPSATNTTYQQAQAQLQQTICAINERDLVIGHLFEQGDSTLGSHPLSVEQVGALRQYYRIAKGSFVVVLIGKDQTEKYRAQQLNSQRIFSTIDAMPMRQQEMEEQLSNC